MQRAWRAEQRVPRLPQFSSIGDGSAVAVQDALFLEHHDAAVDLRMLIETQYWDLAAAALHECERRVPHDMSCWMRITVATREPYLDVTARTSQHCWTILPDNTIVRASATDETATMTCVAAAISPVQQLGAPGSFFGEVGNYNGPIDVNFELTPARD